MSGSSPHAPKGIFPNPFFYTENSVIFGICYYPGNFSLACAISGMSNLVGKAYFIKLQYKESLPRIFVHEATNAKIVTNHGMFCAIYRKIPKFRGKGGA